MANDPKELKSAEGTVLLVDAGTVDFELSKWTEETESLFEWE